MYPRFVGSLDAIHFNAQAVTNRCRAAGIAVAGVTKGVCAHPDVAEAMARGGCESLMDSRVRNLRGLRERGLRVPLWLLRIPMLSEIEDLLDVADGSVVSMGDSLLALDAACAVRKRSFDILAMVDLGDRREGFLPEEIDSFASMLKRCRWLNCLGVGVNLGCFGGVRVTSDNMQALVAVREALSAVLGRPLEHASVGGMLALSLIEEGGMPKGVTHLRVGEALLLGTDTTGRREIPWLRQDALRYETEVVEVCSKPSMPFGEIGLDAFGRKPTFEDRGTRRRAIVASGRQDAHPEDLTPLRQGIRVLGGSSDHTVLDVEDASPSVTLGDVLAFSPSYGAVLSATTSPYVEKVFV